MNKFNMRSFSALANIRASQAKKRLLIGSLLLSAMMLYFYQQFFFQSQPHQVAPQRFIVQGYDINAVIELVNAAGGKISHQLAIIDAVGTTLDPRQRQGLLKNPKIRAIYQDRSIDNAHSPHHHRGSDLDPDSNFAARVQAQQLHDNYINGQGITVAFIDTGVHHKFKNLKKNEYGEQRILVQYDAIKNNTAKNATDKSGHGTHIISIAIGSHTDDKRQQFIGIAPNANLVSVRAFDKNGIGNYLDVIRGIDWVVKNKQQHDIRVLNLSFSAPPRSLYWNDPVNQAVMAAWQAGIVVVASAGNTGPEAMTIGVPANVPYIITVGAMTDNKTANIIDDDTLAIFSAAGPTVEGFVKPDLLAPGGRLLGLMDKKTQIGKDYKNYFFDKHNFVMSGTSQSAAIVTGVVALMLQQDPSLTPDLVKCHLMASAQSAVTAQGELAYSVFQQGAGMVNAYQATYSTVTNCANQDLNIQPDLAGTEHYSGPARRDVDGNYYVREEDNSLWDGGFSEDGYMWKGSRGTRRTNSVWGLDNIWQNGTMWKAGYQWKDGDMYQDGYMWKGSRGTRRINSVWENASMWQDILSESISVNRRVEE